MTLLAQAVEAHAHVLRAHVMCMYVVVRVAVEAHAHVRSRA